MEYHHAILAFLITTATVIIATSRTDRNGDKRRTEVSRSVERIEEYTRTISEELESYARSETDDFKTKEERGERKK